MSSGAARSLCRGTRRSRSAGGLLPRFLTWLWLRGCYAKGHGEPCPSQVSAYCQRNTPKASNWAWANGHLGGGRDANAGRAPGGCLERWRHQHSGPVSTTNFWPKPIELVMVELITQPQLAQGTSTGEPPLEMHCRVQVPSVRTGGLMTLGHTWHELVRTTLRASRQSSGAPEGDEPASG